MIIKDNKSICIIVHPHYWDWEKYHFRGIDRYNYELIKGLKKRGFNLEIIDSGFIKTIFEGAIKELIFPFRFLFKKASLFHAPHPMGAKWAIFLGKKPLITTIHDLVPLFYGGKYDSGLKYIFKRWSIGLAVRKSCRIIMSSNFYKDILVKKFRLPEEKFLVVHYGVDHDEFFPGPIPQNNPRRILLIGEASRAKGVDTAIRAFARLLKSMGNITLIMASQGRELEYLKNLSVELGITNKIEFLDGVPEADLPDLYKTADIFLFPSRYGFGLSSIEAMASGIPVICGKTFDAPDLIKDAGILIDPEKPEELSEAMKKLLTDEVLWNEYRRRGIEHARKFSWDKMVDETIKVYREFY
jgi:glycosyltransferase involved in cell wall biosynthesis